MARRNPGISPILSARGYAARVLWPKYTPSGGVNSGSEVPLPPSNTLQSNMSNLVTHNNPLSGELPPSFLKPDNVAQALKKIGDVTSGKVPPDQKFVVALRGLIYRALNLPGAHISKRERAALAAADLFLYRKGGIHNVDPEFARGLEAARAKLKTSEMPKMPAAHGTAHLLHNPFKPITEPGEGRIEVQSKRGKTLYMTPNQIMKMGSRMLAPGEVERALGARSNPFGRYYGEMYDQDSGSSVSASQAQAEHSAASSHHQYVRTPTMPSAMSQMMGPMRRNPFGLYEELEPGIVFTPDYSDSALDNPSRHRSQMSGSQRATAAKKRSGRHIASSQRRMADITRQAEYEAAMYEDKMYNNPRTFAGAKSKSARAAAALKKSQAKAIARSEAAIGARFVSKAQAMNARAAERDVQRGYYGAMRSGQLPQHARISDYLANPKGAGANDASVKRASGATKLQMRSQILAKLDSGMSHNDVRAEMGLSYPIYMMVLRSHWTK
jgi:hypothetical protein